jgi:hypothetical protein
VTLTRAEYLRLQEQRRILREHPEVREWLRDMVRAELNRRDNAKPSKPPRVERAIDFLRDQLKDGPRAGREIWTAAAELDIREDAIKNGCHALGVDRRGFGKRGSIWTLP